MDGKPITGKKVRSQLSSEIEEWSAKFGVPAEIIVATICPETRSNPNALREEPGYTSDENTPHRISAGLMQTLIFPAKGALQIPTFTRGWLFFHPGDSSKAGTVYIALQWKSTDFDPPKVVCAYNASGMYHNNSPPNRWTMGQYPIGSSEHADRFVVPPFL